MPWRTCGFDSRWALRDFRMQSACLFARGEIGLNEPWNASLLGEKTLGGDSLEKPLDTVLLTQFAIRKGKPTGDGTCLENRRVMSLEGSTPSPSAVCSWPSGKGASLPSWKGGFNSRRALRVQFGDRLTAGRLALNQDVVVRVHLPEPFRVILCQERTPFRGSCCW